MFFSIYVPQFGCILRDNSLYTVYAVSSYTRITIAWRNFRFGVVTGLRTREAVKKDEELSCNYGYGPSAQIKWFREEYRKFRQQHPDKVDQAFDEIFLEHEELKIGRPSTTNDEDEDGSS